MGIFSVESFIASPYSGEISSTLKNQCPIGEDEALVNQENHHVSLGMGKTIEDHHRLQACLRDTHIIGACPLSVKPFDQRKNLRLYPKDFSL